MNIYEVVDSIHKNLLSNEIQSSPISKIKSNEELLFFELLRLSPLSLPYKNKSHRSKELSENKFVINCDSLSNCIIQCDSAKPESINKNNGGSYIDLSNYNLYYYKKARIKLPIIYNLSSLKNIIQSIYNLKLEYSYPLYLFSNSKLEPYPIYYNNSNKKHCGFITDYYNILSFNIKKYVNTESLEDTPKTVNNIFKKINEIKEEKNKEEISDSKDINKNNESDIVNDYSSRWDEIFNVLGMLPKDCPCKQYSKCLYDRCVIKGKPKRGIRPKHMPFCTKKLSEL